MRLHMHMHRCTCIHALYYACIMHALCMHACRSHTRTTPTPPSLPTTPPRLERWCGPLSPSGRVISTLLMESLSPGLRWQAVGLLGNLGKSQKRYDQL